MISFRNSTLFLPALWMLSGVSLLSASLGAPGALAQVATKIPKTPVSKIPKPKDTPNVSEMIPRGNGAMSMRNSGAPSVLGVDDVISVSVIGHPEFSLTEATISSAGQISHPLGGLIKVSGLSLGDAALAVKKSLAVYMKQPVVTVGLVRAHLVQVQVTGAVKVPSIINIGEGWRVTEALSAAGGLLKRAEMTRVSLTRIGDKQSRNLDLQAILDAPNSSANVELKAGDLLRFDEQSVQITVVGQVKNPGSIELSVGSRLFDAIQAAGGTLPRAALSKATLRRSSGKIVQINLLQSASPDVPVVGQSEVGASPNQVGISPSQMGGGQNGAVNGQNGAVGGQNGAANGQSDAVNGQNGAANGQRDAVGSNPVLMTGDFLSVPEQQAHITVLGAVVRSGSVDIPEGKTLRVTDAIAAAGGLNIPARLARIGIARYLPNGRLVPIDVDANALLIDNDLAQNAVLHEDDLITISPRQARTVFVTGQVVKPGPVDADPSEGVLQLLARAGGPTPGAALRKVTVTRGGVVVANLDMLSAVNGGAAPAVSVQDGDYINVPRNDARVVIMPAVRNPGAYPIPEDRPLTIGDALALAGGPQVGAKLTQVVIFRETPNGTTSQLVSLQPKAGMPLATNIVLQDRDFLYVPEASRSKFNPIQTGLQAFAVFGNLLR